MHPPKRTRVLAWFSLLLIFGAGFGAGASTSRLYLEDVLRDVLRSDNRALEDLVWRGAVQKFGVRDDFESEFRRGHAQLLEDSRVARIRNRTEMGPILLTLIDQVAAAVPTENRRRYDDTILRFLLFSSDRYLMSVYFTLGLDYHEVFTIDEILSREYDAVKGSEPLTHERFQTFAKELMLKKLPEVRAALPAEKQKLLDELGPSLENLKPVSVDDVFRRLNFD